MDYSSSTISRSPYAHTDNRCGVDMHFLAYMLSGWARLVSVHEDITVQTGEMLYIPLHCRYQSYWYGKCRGFRWHFAIFPTRRGGRSRSSGLSRPTATATGCWRSRATGRWTAPPPVSC